MVKNKIEKPLQFFSSIGLNESILLYYLEDLATHDVFASSHGNDGLNWSITPLSTLQKTFPFWDKTHLIQLISHLKDSNLLQVDAAALEQNICQFSLTDTLESNQV